MNRPYVRSPLVVALVMGSLVSVACLVGPPALADDDDLSKSVKLLFSINNYGYIDVCGCPKKKLRQGSVTRRTAYLKQLRARGELIVVVDGGNNLFDPKDIRSQRFESKQLIEKAKVIVESYNRMGYRAMAIGYLDMVMGFKQLREYEKMAKFPFLCANLVDRESGELVFEPYTEFEEHGVKIAVLGLINNGLEQYYLDKRAPTIRVTDGLEAAKKYVPELRERNELVIVLSTNKEEFHNQMITEVPGIDLIVDPFLDGFGGIERLIAPEEYCFEKDGVIIARTRPEGHSLGTVDIRLRPDGKPLFNRKKGDVPAGRSSYLYRREPIEPHYGSDPEIDLLVQAFKKGSEFIDTEKLPPLPNKDKYLTASTCQACHEVQYKWWQKTDHADAFAALEETGDQFRQDCIGCHTVGYGQSFVAPKDADPYKNVQCESCHGLNPEHPPDPKKHAWRRVTEKTCIQCHNKARTREDFHYYRQRKRVACPKMKR